jgi:HPt (histidine-containing phosphotransfer) domain-containing protein
MKSTSALLVGCGAILGLFIRLMLTPIVSVDVVPQVAIWATPSEHLRRLATLPLPERGELLRRLDGKTLSRADIRNFALDFSTLSAGSRQSMDMAEYLAAVFEVMQQRVDVGNAITHTDAGSLQLASHTLKGAVGTLAAVAAQDAAQCLENMGRSGNLTGAQAAFTVLKEELNRLQHALTSFLREVPHKPRSR